MNNPYQAPDTEVKPRKEQGNGKVCANRGMILAIAGFIAIPASLLLAFIRDHFPKKESA